ncbi:hypothetical protein NL676_022677 [Syzygium grande]|nr:hypothetical protein NL676_022677 [Syzygium grande]
MLTSIPRKYCNSLYPSFGNDDEDGFSVEQYHLYFLRACFAFEASLILKNQSFIASLCSWRIAATSDRVWLLKMLILMEILYDMLDATNSYPVYRYATSSKEEGEEHFTMLSLIRLIFTPNSISVRVSHDTRLAVELICPMYTSCPEAVKRVALDVLI